MNYEMNYEARALRLPGLVLEIGTRIVVVDSRGRVLSGVFLGYSSSFIAIGNDECKPVRFLNIKRVNEIIVIGKVDCNGEGGESKEDRGLETGRDSEATH